MTGQRIFLLLLAFGSLTRANAGNFLYNTPQQAYGTLRRTFSDDFYLHEK